MLVEKNFARPDLASTLLFLTLSFIAYCIKKEHLNYSHVQENVLLGTYLDFTPKKS